MTLKELDHTIRDWREHVPNARWYALLDGAQYEQETGKRLDVKDGGLTPLFAGTDDEALAHAGPWLVEIISERRAATIANLEAARPCVVWLISDDDPATLAAKLRQRLTATHADGRTLLMRCWDPRAVHALWNSLSAPARLDYFDAAYSWSYLYDGMRREISNSCKLQNR